MYKKIKAKILYEPFELYFPKHHTSPEKVLSS